MPRVPVCQLPKVVLAAKKKFGTLAAKKEFGTINAKKKKSMIVPDILFHNMLHVLTHRCELPKVVLAAKKKVWHFGCQKKVWHDPRQK